MLKRLLTIGIMISLYSVSMYADDTRKVTFETNYGKIVLEVYPKAAPNLTTRFLELSEKQYYTGTLFHYINTDFIIAGGDLNTRLEPLDKEIIEKYDKLDDEISATALGLHRLLVRNSYLGNHLERDNPARRWSMKEFLEYQGYSFDDSLPSIPIEYGSIAMASNKPNSNYTQFFIVTSKNGAPWLSGKNTVIGKVVEGMEVVHIIETLPHDEYNFPIAEKRPEIINITVK